MSVAPDVAALRVDATQLERAFANLLENARRYSDGAPVSVEVRGDGSSVSVCIVDQGPGIPLEDRERIFEPFYRGAQPDRPWGGSGLGLAIAKGFVEANGGRITVESVPGGGTSFVVTFPVERPAQVPT